PPAPRSARPGDDRRFRRHRHGVVRVAGTDHGAPADFRHGLAQRTPAARPRSRPPPGPAAPYGARNPRFRSDRAPILGGAFGGLKNRKLNGNMVMVRHFP